MGGRKIAGKTPSKPTFPDPTGFNPKKTLGFIRDPIYSYIPYTKSSLENEVTEESLINSPWMQRLRRLRQNQWAYMVYPSLQHTRFEHSLGVMHLAGLFAKTWYQQYYFQKKKVLPTIPLPSVFFP